jgi:hypothetical protein
MDLSNYLSAENLIADNEACCRVDGLGVRG